MASDSEQDFAREVVDVPITKEMGDSFLAYSLSVITSRAIPDVRDGLKPVQRRILYSMYRMGLRPDRPHRKCAHVVGDVMGKYHPHGDSAIYDALVRMGQDFTRPVTLVDPQGNFGSLDDPPAAQRYTECRLTPAAIDLVAEIDEETVAWGPTYDGETLEPIYMPGLLPNLLVNGTSGIAVGMATNMPTHNLLEVYEAVKLVMTKRRPKPTVDELMAVLPGPDFSTGATVIDDDLRTAYATGRGTFRIRAKAEVIDVTKVRKGIKFTELPYLVGVERVVTKINELVKSEKLGGVADVKNLSDHDSGLELVVECKPGVSAEMLLEQLYRFTPLEETFGVNNVVLVNGVPTTVGLYELCQHYIDHRLDVVVKRSEYRLRKAEERLHILEGLIIAIDNIDLVIRIIRGSASSTEARQGLMQQLDLTEIQAEHILELKLRRLTALAYDEVVDEIAELKTKIADLKKILGSEQRQRTIVIRELGEIAKKYGRPRRTVIINPSALPDLADLETKAVSSMPDDPCVVSLAASGVVGREPQGTSKSYTPGRHDVIESLVMTSTRSRVMTITSTGRLLSVMASDIAEVGGRSRGADGAEVFSADKGETLLNVFGRTGPPLLLVTAAGVMKRIERESLADLKAGRSVIKLAPRDRVVAVMECAEDDHVVVVSSDAQALQTQVSNVSVQGPSAKGVAGMSLKGNSKVVGAGIATDGAVVITVTDVGTAKSTRVDELPIKGRNTGGIRITKFKDERRLDYAWVGLPERIVAVVGADGSTSKPAPSPESVALKPTRRDGASGRAPHRILRVGTLRW